MKNYKFFNTNVKKILTYIFILFVLPFILFSSFNVIKFLYTFHAGIKVTNNSNKNMYVTQIKANDKIVYTGNAYYKANTRWIDYSYPLGISVFDIFSENLKLEFTTKDDKNLSYKSYCTVEFSEECQILTFNFNNTCGCDGMKSSEAFD